MLAWPFEAIQLSAQSTTLKLPEMNDLEREIFELVKTIQPQAMYSAGLEELAEKIFIPSEENVNLALARVRELKKRCNQRDDLTLKFLESIECILEFSEPGPEIGSIVEVLSVHLIKEGLNIARFKRLLDSLTDSIKVSIEKFANRDISAAVRILASYQVLGVFEILDVIEKEGNDSELSEKIATLKARVTEFKNNLFVEGFTDGQFEQVSEILKKHGAGLGREKFYPLALGSGFDYSESPMKLERKGVSWIKEDLPKFRRATNSLARILGCKPEPESVKAELKSRPGVSPKDSLAITLRVRPIIQSFIGESVVGINPRYDCVVVETPPYLTAILPTAAAQGFDLLTDSPKTRYFLTTDERRAPPAGFADLVSTLVHEEYGHCLHFSNTCTAFAARPGFIEQLPSLHTGPTSEGLAFNREIEFLDALHRLAKKKPSNYSRAESDFVELIKEFGGLQHVLPEFDFETYRMRIIRFLRVVGDSRINSAKQNLLDFLEWAEKKTGLLQRTVFYQLFPAHEGIFPGYATCYAVVGQEIRTIQKPFRNDPKKLVKFNAFACSMGYPARSIYIRRLKKFAEELKGRKVGKNPRARTETEKRKGCK